MARRPRNATITAVRGVRVGHWTASAAKGTGCTVVELPEPNIVAAEVRGAAPGTRELGLLQPGMTVEQCHAIVLAGGSAFGLAAADGVMKELASRGRGHPTQFGPVPIVPAAVVFDRGVGDPDAFPTARSGAVAVRAATSDPVRLGAVGVGAGCTIGKWQGRPQPAGLGSALVKIDSVSVGALVALNATGDVMSLDGRNLTGGDPQPGAPTRVDTQENTTLVVVATDVRLSRAELSRIIVRAHDALGACLRPAHTRYDGDICFAVSCPRPRRERAPGDLDIAGEAAFRAVGRAIETALPLLA